MRSSNRPNSVRKHRAPKGALRRLFSSYKLSRSTKSQKAPSAKRCIKTSRPVLRTQPIQIRQKAPSAKRCIKTPVLRPLHARLTSARKHRAPKGALRRSCSCSAHAVSWIARKHRAPKGALRPIRGVTIIGNNVDRQKAPSAKRCIKTHHCISPFVRGLLLSESTERQKVH